MGAAGYPRNGDDRDLLVQAADLAVYKAKNIGRNCVVANPGEEA